MTRPLTPRAQAILAAVEREVAARLSELERDAEPVAPASPRRFARAAPRPTSDLLLALELGVAGWSRAEVAQRLGGADADPVLDAVFGGGSAPGARLARTA